MNNWKLLKHSQQKFDFLNGVTNLSVDDVTGSVAITTNSTVHVISQAGSVENHKFQASHLEKIQFVHVISSPLICISTEKSMTIWNYMDGTSEDFIELEAAILTVEWSPDFSIGVVITNDLKITLISSALEQLAESNLQQEGFGAAEFITVGWGKKETQFHGSVGKQAAIQVKETMTPLSEWDNGSALIAWKPDGDYFAVNWVVTGSGTSYRQIRIFTSEAVLHSTAEPVSIVEQGLCWNPKKNLLATSQRHPTGLNVIFFESNGLRHGEFQLFPSRNMKNNEIPSPSCISSNHVKVNDLAFNREGDLFAVSFLSIQDDVDLSFVRLYSNCNYYWYVKQELRLEQPLFKWCPIDSNRLHLLHSRDTYLTCWWSSTIHRSEIIHLEEDPALVAVIDGKSVQMTPFRSMVIPPPMSAYSVAFQWPVNFLCLPGVHVGDRSASWLSACFVVLSNGDSYIIDYSSHGAQQTVTPDDVTVSVGPACGGADFRVRCKLPSAVTNIDICFEEFLNHGVWLSPNLICLTSGATIFLLQKDSQKSSWTLKKCYELTSNIVAVCSSAFSNQQLYIETESADVFSCSIESMLSRSHCITVDTLEVFNLPPSLTDSVEGAPPLKREFRFPQVCTQMYSVIVDGEELLIGLSNTSHQLYAKMKPLMSLCSSVALHREFLVVTSMLQTISSIPLNVKLPEFYQFFDDQADKNVGTFENKLRYDEKIRAIEPGAFIVTVVPMDTKVILQMPRGNLESIHPRALVLSCLRELIDGCQYCRAVDLMKRHRINFNLLYDHNPETFLSNIEKFVTDVDNPTILNIFLADIIPEDLTKTMYSKFYKTSALNLWSIDDLENQLSKPDRLTNAMITCLNKMDQKKYLFCILTCYAKQSKPQLDQALIRMQKYKDAGDVSTWESCLQHLKYLCDVVQLYHISLATYDLELAASVAQYTQLDPKEYIPFLNELRALPEYVKRYRIDLLLKNYPLALTNIYQAGEEYFQDCLQLVKNHKLFSDALDLYPKQSNHYRTLSESFAEYLIKEERSLSSAGTVYLRAHLYKQAADCFYRANNCTQWLLAAVHLNQEERLKQSRELAVRLIDLNRFSEAVVIYEEHLQDHEEAIKTASKGSLWETALRLSNLHSLSSLVDSTILPDLNHCCEDFIDRLSNHKSEFITHRQRLLIARQKHRQDYQDKLMQKDFGDGDDQSEIFSDISSVSGSSAVTASSRYSGKSSSSKASGRSSKTKRKAERKKWTLKEGSALEEVALMEVLYKNISVAQDFVDECRLLIDTQIAIGSCSVSRNLLKEINTLLRLQSDSLATIWDGFTWPVKLTNSITAHYNMTNLITATNNGDNNQGRKLYDIQEEFLYFPPKMISRSIKHPVL